MAAPKGHPRYGGRPKGALNKRTIEKAARLEREIIQAEKSGKKLPHQMLYDAAEYFGGMMAHYQPSTSKATNPNNPDGKSDRKFWRAAKMHIACARMAAEFYSPRLKALAVAITDPAGSLAGKAPVTIDAENVTQIKDANVLSQNYKQLMGRKPEAA